jgi:pimeloyl-ACP methyl ester carboxylesterase
MPDIDVDRSFMSLPALANADAGLVRRGRHLSTTFLLEADDVSYLVHVREGQVAGVERGPFLMRPWSFAVRASADAWRRFWRPVPEPGYHDVFAMKKLGVARVEGDLVPLMAHLRYVQELLAAPRRRAAASPAPAPGSGAGAAPEVLLEPMVGRYLRLALGGRPHRVYFEEAGQGIPLVCLHTAGADGRQFRHLLADPAVTAHFRALAFDMPWHGKSLPPEGWQEEEYRLTTRAYVELVLAFCDALRLERPVVLGCSIGGKIVLELARAHPERFRALIGLESAAYQPPWYDDTGWLHRPDVHGGEVCGALMSGLVGPESPAATRWETLWGYMQGGPGVFKGDLHFYRVDGDFRDRVGEIDASRCPLYLLTGEYDFSCTPADTRATAEKIPGARFTVMRGIGHFPMSEHPQQFRSYLLPVLDEIRAAST